jgi:hypothetical protein
MIGFLILELGGWRERDMRRSIALAATALAAAGVAGPLNPLFLGLASSAAFLLAGWGEGRRYQLSQVSRRRLLAYPLPAWKIAAGKALSAAAVWLCLLFALSPILAASALVWGLSARTIGSCLLAWLSAFLVAAAAGFFSSFALEKAEGLGGWLLFVIWLASSFFVLWLEPTNPFLQAWRILMLDQRPGIYLGMAAEAAAALLLLAASVPSIAKAKKKYEEEP